MIWANPVSYFQWIILENYINSLFTENMMLADHENALVTLNYLQWMIMINHISVLFTKKIILANNMSYLQRIIANGINAFLKRKIANYLNSLVTVNIWSCMLYIINSFSLVDVTGKSQMP